MSAEPIEPNERTVALAEHRLEDAIAWWRNGQGSLVRICRRRESKG